VLVQAPLQLTKVDDGFGVAIPNTASDSVKLRSGGAYPPPFQNSIVPPPVPAVLADRVYDVMVPKISAVESKNPIPIIGKNTVAKTRRIQEKNYMRNYIQKQAFWQAFR